MTPPHRHAAQQRVLAQLLRYSTIRREAADKVDALIREAVGLGIPQTQVANVAGLTQASISRLVKRPPAGSIGRGRRSRATTGAGGGTV